MGKATGKKQATNSLAAAFKNAKPAPPKPVEEAKPAAVEEDVVIESEEEEEEDDFVGARRRHGRVRAETPEPEDNLDAGDMVDVGSEEPAGAAAEPAAPAGDIESAVRKRAAPADEPAMPPPAPGMTRRLVTKKKKFVDERGRTVTETVREWEEVPIEEAGATAAAAAEEKAPKEAAEPAAAPAAAKTQKTLMSFFSRK